jgi:hypothetical protein
MQVKLLVTGATCDVVAVVDGEECPAETFIQDGEKATEACREGLLVLLGHVADNGLQGISGANWHEVSKKEQIYEFIKGPLRLFFFKGDGRHVAVCASGGRKKGQKVDSKAVKKAAGYRKQYVEAVAANTLEVVKNGDVD